MVVARQQELVELLRALPAATVVVEGTCFPGVRVAIGSATHAVDDAWKGVRFQRNRQSHTVELTGIASAT